MGKQRKEKLEKALSQPAAPVPQQPSLEQVWNQLRDEIRNLIKSLPDTRGVIEIITQKYELMLTVTAELYKNWQEEVKVWKARAEKAEARVKELEEKYEPKKPEKDAAASEKKAEGGGKTQ